MPPFGSHSPCGAEGGLSNVVAGGFATVNGAVMTPAALEITGLRVDLGGARIISAIDMSVEPGWFVAVVGPNGAGKSTLMRSIYRAISPTAGVIEIDGASIKEFSSRELALQMSVVTQEHHGEFEFTVGEVVAMGRIPHRSGWGSLGTEDHEVINRSLVDVGASEFIKRRFSTLSGGEKQRVLLARALAQQPRYLLLDEPTNHLDIRYQLEMIAFVRDLGVTVIAALHDLNLAAQHADRVLMVDAGCVRSYGTPEEVFVPDTVQEVFGVRATPVVHPVNNRLQLLFDLVDRGSS